MDDGSQNLEESAAMLESLKRQGVGFVFLTPHFYADRETIDDFLKRREDSMQKLIPVAEKEGIHVYPACEMHFSDYIFNCANLSPLCINTTKYLLTELPLSCSFSERTIEKLSRLQASYNVIPVLAHIERYPGLMRNRSNLSRLIDLGCKAQINLNSLKRGFWRRRTLLHFIEDGLVQFVGTDCHNMTSRPPVYTSGIKMIEKKAGADYVDLLMENAYRIIE